MDAVEEIKIDEIKEEIVNLDESDIAQMTKPDLMHFVEEVIVENQEIFPGISIGKDDVLFMNNNELKNVIMDVAGQVKVEELKEEIENLDEETVSDMSINELRDIVEEVAVESVDLPLTYQLKRKMFCS